MNKYLATLIFYAVACAIIFLLNKISPNAQDGGPGLGSIAIMLMAVVIIGLVIFNVYRGIRVDKAYFIIAVIHAMVLVVGIYRFFM